MSFKSLTAQTVQFRLGISAPFGLKKKQLTN